MIISILKFFLVFFLNYYAAINFNNSDKFTYPEYLSQSKASVTTTQVVQGVKHIHYIIAEYPWNINVLETDLKEKNITFETVKGKDKIFDSRETLTSMIKRKSDSNNKIIAGINADFFSMKNGDINNNQISNGIFIKGISNSRYQLCITYDNIPYIENFKFTGKIFYRNKKSIDINAINYTRGKDSLVLYNSYWGNSTSTNGKGIEFIIKPLNQWKVNEKIRVIITDKNDSNSMISPDYAILSGDGLTATTLNANLNIGDTLFLYLGTIPKIDNLKELIGGMPLIIKDGKDISISDSTKSLKEISREGGSNKFVTNRHPRTAVGFIKDKTKLFFITVDGRQSKSVGMSLPELSQFMVSLGCYQGLNFDGGGSTTMIIQNKIVNSPSDITGERPIGNSILVRNRNK